MSRSWPCSVLPARNATKLTRNTAECGADTGSEAFARIRGYPSTLRKPGVALLATLQSVFSSQPLYPALD
jgi:hypothetical protein